MPALITWWTQDATELAPHADADAITAEGVRLLGRWTEPHRRYHTTQHLVEMFWALGDLEEAGEVTAEQARIARIAAWYHDAHYNPRAEAGSNEHRSATLARDHLHALGVQTAVVDEVERLVLLTVDHDASTLTDDDALGRAFIDADLWVLSADEARYDEYATQVREEYAHVPDEHFRPARCLVLQGLAAGEVYRTDLARRDWIAQARANLAGEITALSA